MANTFKFTPEELQEKFDEYYNEKAFMTKRTSTSGDVYKDVEEIRHVPISIQGLCLHLKVNSKYLYGLKGREEYADVLDYIDLKMEEHINTGIAMGDIAQSYGIFYLKNKFGYRDTKQIEAEVTQKEAPKIEIVSDDES
jgi:hypothetical protein